MKLILALACLAVACFASGCNHTDPEAKDPPISGVWRINPGAP